eukprot:gene3827-4217_t
MRPAALFDVDVNAVTVSLEPGGTAYEVEYRKDGPGDWVPMASTIKGTLVKKKNLDTDAAYVFRYRPSGGAWAPDSEPMSTLDPLLKRPDPPTLASSDAESITVEWQADAKEYLVEMCCDCPGPDHMVWKPLSKPLSSPAMRKKNLDVNRMYYIRVMPCREGAHFSPAAGPFSPSRLPPAFASMFGTIQLQDRQHQ